MLGEAKNEKIDRSAMIIFRLQFLLKRNANRQINTLTYYTKVQNFGETTK